MKKPAKCLPDTSVVVRYLTRDVEPLYARAKLFFDRVIEGSQRAIVLESVIAESVYVLTKVYRVPKREAARSLIDVLRYKGIANADQKELIQALALFSERNIDIVDAILCVKASGPDRSLLSFDGDLNKISESRRAAGRQDEKF